MTALFSPVVGWLGLGGVVIAGAVAFGLFVPRFLYVAIIVAAVTAAAMFVFGKGVYYEHTVDKKVESEAADNALKQEQKAATDADRSVHGKPGWMRHHDPYARD